MNYKNMFKLLCSTLCLLLLGLASLVGAQIYQWKSVAIGGGGFVSAVIPSKTEQGLVYARTDVGGAYRWDKNKSRWIPLLDWVSDEETGILGVESLALDPQISSRLYMLAGISYFNDGKTYLLRSDDYGKTFSITNVTRQFKAHGNGMGRQTGEKLQVDPVNSNLLYVGTRWNGLFKSTDAGVSWARMSALNITGTPNENGISFVLIDPNSAANGVSQRIFVGISRFPSVGANFYRSDDAGKNFIAVEGAPKGLMPQRAIFSGDGNLYITYANGAGPHSHWAQPEPMDKGQLWKFNITSGSWTNVTPKGFTRSLAGISVDPKNPQRLILSSVNTYLPLQGGAWGDRLFITTNGGVSWTDIIARGFSMDNNGVSWINGHSIHWAGSFEFDPFDSKRAWVTSGNGIFKTNNLDAIPTNWIFDVAGIEETVPLNMVSLPDSPLLTVIADYDGFRHQNPSEYAPIHTPRMGTTTGLAVAARMTNKVARSGGGDSPTIYISSDSGINWVKASSKGKNGQLAFSADGKVLLHSPENSATSYRSANSGKRWAAVSGLDVPSARIVADPINSNKFYALNGKTMMVSTDAGVSFSAAGRLKSPGSTVMSLAPDREGDIWVALHSGGLARSTDSGGSFSTLKTVTYAAAVGFGKAAPGAAYPAIYIWGTVKGVRGVHMSTDIGATWVRINDDDHEYGGPGNGQFILGDMNLFGRVFMSTAGRGVVYGEPVN